MGTSSTSILIFSPHPDDDILACGGTIAHKLRKGHRISIVYMTDGRHSYSAHNMQDIAGCPTPEELKGIRYKEAISAVRWLGVPEQNLFFLDYEDGSLEYFISPAATRVKLILDEINPGEIYYPSEIDSHRDHKATAAVVTSVLDKTNHECRRFVYLIWKLRGTPLAYQNRIKRSSIKDVLDLKKKALYEHKSQITLLFPQQPKPILHPDFVESFLSDYEEFLVA